MNVTFGVSQFADAFFFCFAQYCQLLVCSIIVAKNKIEIRNPDIYSKMKIKTKNRKQTTNKMKDTALPIQYLWHTKKTKKKKDTRCFFFPFQT